MASGDSTNFSDLLQIAQPAEKVQTLIESLVAYVDIASIPTGNCFSKVECLYDASEVLEEIRKGFKKEPAHSRKRIADIVESIVPRAEKGYYLKLGSKLLVFQSGRSNLLDLLGGKDEDDCIILIPIAIGGAAEAELHDSRTGRETTFTFETKSELIIAARCSIRVQPQSKVVCVVLCVGRDKE